MRLADSRSAVLRRPRPPSMLKAAARDLPMASRFSNVEPEPLEAGHRSRAAIAYVLDGFPDPLHSSVLDEVEELGRCGVDVHVIVVADDHLCIINPWFGVRAPATASLRGEEWYRLLALDATRAGVMQVQADWISRHVSTHRIQHLHAQPGTADVARLVKRATGAGYSFIASATEVHQDPRRVEWLQATAREADFVVAPTDASRAHLLKAAGPGLSHTVHRINWGVNLEKYQFHQESGRFPNSVLAVCPLVEGSGVDDLITAVTILRDRRAAPVRLTIVGDGAHETGVRARIALHRLDDRVTLLPTTTGTRLLPLMCGHSVMALPYGVPPDGAVEDVPPVLLQAMAVGLPVLSTFVRPVSEVLDDGRTGRLVTPRDPAWLAGALENMLDDATLRVSIARSAREKVERQFALSRNVPRLARLFAMATSGRTLAH